MHPRDCSLQHFAAYMVFGLIYQLLFAETDTNWLVVAISPILALIMFWLAYQEVRKASARA